MVVVFLCLFLLNWVATFDLSFELVAVAKVAIAIVAECVVAFGIGFVVLFLFLPFLFLSAVGLVVEFVMLLCFRTLLNDVLASHTSDGHLEREQAATFDVDFVYLCLCL